MYARTGEINIGQLVRYKFPCQFPMIAYDRTFRERMGLHNSFNIGFTTSVGTVTAATRWGGEAQKMTLNEPEDDTYEHIFRQTKLDEFTLILRRADGTKLNPDLGTSQSCLDRFSLVCFKVRSSVSYS